MITFFTIIIVMNLIAWVYAKKELKKVESKLEESNGYLKKVYEDRWDFIKRTKERIETDSMDKKTI